MQNARYFQWAAVLALVCAGAVDAGDRVYPNAKAVKPLSAGAQVPSARIKTVAGDPVDLAHLVQDRGALLVFYRGGW